MPASYTPWIPPLAGEHPRLFFSKRLKVAITNLSGAFSLGENIQGATSGATGLVRGGIDSMLHYIPQLSTFQAGETIAGLTSGATATASAAPVDESLSVATIQARRTGALSSYWGSCTSEANTRKNAASYNNDWFLTRDPEYVANMAFVYAIDSSRTAEADRAIAIALHVAAQGGTDSRTARDWVQILAFVYDWAYGRSYQGSTSWRATVRAAIKLHVQSLYDINPAEYFWGTSHGDSSAAWLGIMAILRDGSSAENTDWDAKMDYILDNHISGSTNATYMAGFRYYGDQDGGTNKGMGPLGYSRANIEFYYKCMPALWSSVDVDWHITEGWWRQILKFFIAMWRPDRTFFRKGENQGQSKYNKEVTLAAVQRAGQEPNAFGEHCLWLETEAEALSDGQAYGPWNLYQVCFRPTSLLAVRPTAARYGGKHMHVFRNAGQIMFRPGWSENDPVWAWDLEPDFTGGHTKRRAGNIQLAAFGQPILRDAGSYDPSQSTGYKILSSGGTPDAVQTGHRWSYSKRTSSAARIWRIYDTDEPTENFKRFMQYQVKNSGRFGVLQGTSTYTESNDGGQLWPKGAGDQSQPDSYADILAQAAEYRRATFALDPPVEDTATSSLYAYGVADLAPCYYSGKLTKLIQHVLYIKPGAIPGWSYPILLVVEDIVAHVDATKGKKTVQLIMNSGVQASGAAASLQYDPGAARLFYRTLKPSSIEVAHVSGPDVEGITYPPTNQKGFDDVAAWRAELNVTASAGSQEWVTVMCPCPDSVGAPPSLALIDDATYLGATIGGIECKVKRAAPYVAQVGSSTDTTPPADPTGLAGTPGSVFADLTWNLGGEGDLAGYEIYRSDPL